MQYKISFILTCLLTSPINAEEIERGTITTCGYQAGTAREIQQIRQNEGDDWARFEQNVKKIYKEGQGRSDLLVIAKNVYIQPFSTPPDEAYQTIFKACVARIKGTENTL